MKIQFVAVFNKHERNPSKKNWGVWRGKGYPLEPRLLSTYLNMSAFPMKLFNEIKVPFTF